MSGPVGEARVVVVADDDPGMRLLVTSTLRVDGTRVLEAADGAAAWALIQEHRPTVAVLDFRMPELNGIDLTRRIKAHPALAATRVILLTASTQAADVRAGLDSGAEAYLTKPFSPQELLTVVEQV